VTDHPAGPRPDPAAFVRAAAAGAPLDDEAADAARDRWASRAKPPGSLGRLEDLGAHLAAVTGRCPPAVPARPAVAVFAGDHGVARDGVTAWPQEVTAFMVAGFAAGGAAVHAFARTVGASVDVVDVGVAGDLGGLTGIRHHKVRAGTASLASGPAMTVDEATAALAVGAAVADDLVAAGADLLIGGDMGIGNTTPSACLVAAFTGRPAAAVTGFGAGLPADRLDHKRAVIEGALERVRGERDPLALLAELGGLEIAALAGFHVAAAAARVPFVVDGVIAGAALLVADALAPGTAARAIAGHRSCEPAASVLLEHLRLVPLLDLELRLGEGTGAVLAVPLVQAAARALAEMADLPM
jgi:nicotinate-nucleotide--dimethylbenzimidazole phosphoribosyltransferase